jgi:hypothetical protein
VDILIWRRKMSREYKVSYWEDGDYEVTTPTVDVDGDNVDLQVFQGSLSDCEAFIRLKEGGYM